MATFVGRASEIQLLQASYAEASSGNPRTVVVEGEPGLGKTALLDAFVATLPPGTVLSGSGDEAERFYRFGVLGQLLNARELGWPDPFSAGADVLRLLDDRTEPAATVFVVDDAHLADPESLAALTFALRRLGPDRVLAVVATRSAEADRLPAGLLKLADAHGARLRLEGLGEDDVIRLASLHGVDQLSRRAAARLLAHTAGSPLYLRALIDELSPDVLESSGPLPAPQSYSMLVLSLVAPLSAAARRLAGAAAVLGPGALLADAAAVGEVADPETVLDEVIRARVVSCTYADDGWRLGFSHPLARAALYDDLGPHDRRQLHLRAAELAAPDQALQHRFAACSGPDPELAEELADRAGQLRARGDVRAAADLFMKAGRLAADESTPWLMDAAALFLSAGDVAAAKSAEESMADDAVNASRYYLRARIAWFGGEPSSAAELAAAAWEGADQLDRAGRGDLAAILAQLSNMQGDGLEAARWAELALTEELAPDVADMTAAARAVGLMIAGRPDDALAALGDLAEQPAHVGPQQHHQLTARGALRGALDDLPGARLDLSSLVSSSPSDVAPQRLVGMGVLAEVDYRLGRWDNAVTLADQALSLAEDSEQVWVEGYLHAVATLVAAARGWWERAESHLAAGLGLAEQLGDPATWAVCQNAAVHLASCRAEPDLVVERSQPLLALRIGPLEEPGWLGWPVEHVAALIQLGRFDDVAEELAHLGGIAAERGSRSRLAALARLRGELATAQRDNTAAREAFEEALVLGEHADALEWARIRASYGRFLRRRGERRAARAQLEEAHARLRELGAKPFEESCAEELAACGAPADPSSESPLDVLTPQEQIVVRLVTEGHTNPEIARQLVLSVKTVGYHLGNAYTKLGVHSRTQLAARIAPQAASQAAPAGR